jgi:hypothetical protein
VVELEAILGRAGPGLYHGTAGIVLALLEAHAHFCDARWGELALRGTRYQPAARDGAGAGADGSSGREANG